MAENEDVKDEVTLREGIEDELNGLVQYLASTEDPTSDKYRTALDATIALGTMWNNMCKIKCEERKATLESEDREAQRKHEWKMKEAELQMKEAELKAKKEADEKAFEIKQMEIKAKKEADETAYQIKQLEIIDMNKVHAKDWLDSALKLTATILPPAALIGTCIIGWANENNPVKPLILTSATTRQTNNILSGMTSRLGK